LGITEAHHLGDEVLKAGQNGLLAPALRPVRP